ncbi:MAG TPA: family 16 glycoside hydrolase [Rhodothermales bacterium]
MTRSPVSLRWFLLLAALFPLSVAAQELPAGLPPSEVPLTDLSAFANPTANWRIAGGAVANPDVQGNLRATPGSGVLVNEPSGDASGHLFTRWEHGDLDLDLDVMLARGANSGIYLQGRYEVQLFDSWGVQHPRHSDLGGIYQRFDESRPEGTQGYQGHPPRMIAARAPGLWQHIHIEFRAPRFDEGGRKIEDARFERVVVNGVVVQEDVAVTGPTRAAAFEDEAPTGPLMIQGNLGSLAVRNIRYKRYDVAPAQLTNIHYDAYEGRFQSLTDVQVAQPVRSGTTDAIRWNVVNRRDDFAVVFEADFNAPASGEYQFALVCEGGCRLEIGDLALGPDAAGEGWVSTAETVTLTAGTHPFRLTYYKSFRWWRPTLMAFVEGPGFARTPLHARMVGQYPEPDPIFLRVDSRPKVLRSFVNHGGVKLTHAVSVGSPGGAHYSYDLDTGTLLRIWRGEFLDVTQMWFERGEPQVAVPRGSVIDFERRPLVVMGDAEGPSSDSLAAVTLKYEGYTIDSTGYPVYRYAARDLALTDRLVASDDGREIERRITASGSAGTAWLRLVSSHEINPMGHGTYAVGDREYYVVLHEPAEEALIVRRRNGLQELMVPVPADGSSVTYAVRW